MRLRKARLNNCVKEVFGKYGQCQNCGAPLSSYRCEYCGTVYADDMEAEKRIDEERERIDKLHSLILQARIEAQLAEMNASLRDSNIKPEKKKSLFSWLFGD